MASVGHIELSDGFFHQKTLKWAFIYENHVGSNQLGKPNFNYVHDNATPTPQ